MYYFTINKFYFFLSLLNKIYDFDYPWFSVIRAAPSPPLPRIIESTLY
jgi:hypothetical protein